MAWKALAVALCLAATALGSPAPEPDPASSFSRGAVEGSPQRDASAVPADSQEFGSKSLPLRNSVESVPLKSLRELEEERVPLRDAIETRPDTGSVVALRAASASQTKSQSMHEEHVSSEYKQYYGAASHFNENKKSDRLQQGNLNLEEMRQTAASGAATAAGVAPAPARRLVVCYVQGWAAYRVPPLAFTAGLVPAACTHLHYAFATLHPDTYAVTPTDYDYDVIRGGYRSVTGLRHSRPALRVLLSVGGSGSERLMAAMARDPSHRSTFVESAVAFLKEYSFDGLELHWAYPGERESHEKEELTALLYELREKFTPQDLILSVILPSSRNLIEDGYDLGALSGAADYAVLQAWDMHAETRDEAPRRATHHSPLRSETASGVSNRYENVEFAVKYLLKKGMAKEKLVLGVPMFGRSFTLSNPSISKPGAFVSGWGEEGTYTQNQGLLAYFEICMAVREGRGNVNTDSDGNAYAVLGDQWVGFDNVQSIAEKMRFAARTGLAGGAAWAIDMDDFRGLCGEKWPLITAMAQAINDEPVRPSDSQLKAVSFCERDAAAPAAAYLASDATSCAAYTLCSGGVRYQLLCEHNTLYDPTTGRCGHMDVSKCVPGQTLRISIADAALTTSDDSIESELSTIEASSQRVATSSKYENIKENVDTITSESVSETSEISSNNEANQSNRNVEPFATMSNNDIKKNSENIMKTSSNWDQTVKEIISSTHSQKSQSTTTESKGENIVLDSRNAILISSVSDKMNAMNLENEELKINNINKANSQSRPTTEQKKFYHTNINQSTTDHMGLNTNDKLYTASDTMNVANFEKETLTINEENLADSQSRPTKDQTILHQTNVIQPAANRMGSNTVDKLSSASDIMNEANFEKETLTINEENYADSQSRPNTEQTIINQTYAIQSVNDHMESNTFEKLSSTSNTMNVANFEKESLTINKINEENYADSQSRRTTEPTIIDQTYAIQSVNNHMKTNIVEKLSSVSNTMNVANFEKETLTINEENLADSQRRPTKDQTILHQTNVIQPAADRMGSNTVDKLSSASDIMNEANFEKETLTINKINEENYADSQSRLNTEQTIINQTYAIQSVNDHMKSNTFEKLSSASNTMNVANFEKESLTINKVNKENNADSQSRQTTEPSIIDQTYAIQSVNNHMESNTVEKLSSVSNTMNVANFEKETLTINEENQADSQSRPITEQTIIDQTHVIQSVTDPIGSNTVEALNSASEHITESNNIFIAQDETISDSNDITYENLTSSTEAISLNQDQSSASLQSTSINSESINIEQISHNEFDQDHTSSSHEGAVVPGSNVEVGENEAKQKEKLLVCFMTNWAFYRRGEGKFVPEHVDTRLCTHLVYAYATLTPDKLIAKEFDPWTDIDNNLYERVTSLKDVKVLLGLGGWTDSAGDKYSRLVSSRATRKNFITNLVAFLRQHHFAGVHLDWNYPVCWQSDCDKGPGSDKANFAKLIQELSSELHAAGMEVGVAVSGYKEIIERAYDLAALSSSADFLSAMTYDYHGGWEESVSHSTPLTPRPDDSLPAYTIEYAIKTLISGGANPKKLLLGLAFYGQSYRLEETEGAAVPGSPASGPGEPGEFTKQPGMLAYYEICYRMKNLRWKSGRQEGAGPYTYSRDQWVGFDDQKSIKEKVEWGLRQGLGGVAAWTVDLDDFSNRCCAEPSPLLRAASRALGRSTPAPPAAACARPPAPATPPPPTTTTIDSISGGGGPHDHGSSSTTWPSWSPASSTTGPTSTPATRPTWWPTAASTTTSTTTRAPPTTTTTTTTTAKPVVVPPAGGSDDTLEGGRCDGLAGDYHAAAGSCDAYLQCVGGTWRKQRCAPGLHWSVKAKRCDWPRQAKCDEVSSGSESSGSATSTLAPTTSRPPVPRPTTTTSTTTTTTTTTTRRPLPLPPSTTEISAEPSGDGEVTENGSCDGLAGDYHAAAGSCDAYLQCVGGTWRKQRCALGLHWSAKAQRCDWPRQAKCDAGNKAPIAAAPTTTTTTTTAAPTSPPLQDEDIEVLKPGMACQTGTYHAHPRCSKFFVCVNGALVTQSCPPGLAWSRDRRMCDFPAQARCTEQRRPATPAKDKPLSDSPTAAIMEQPMSMSSCSDGTYSAYPGDCGRYRHCQHGTYRQFRCSAGLHWNQGKQICDWPKNAHCKEGEGAADNSDVEVQPPPVTPTSEPAWSPPASTAEPSTLKPTTTTITLLDQPDIVKSPYKLVCYFTNWAWYRPGLGKYVPEDIDPTLCTHIVYGFAVLGYDGTITAHDSWADYDNRFYERVVAYKKHGIKVSLALGGWNDSAGDKYSKLVNSAAARAKFVTHAVQFLVKYGFDGLDLDWEYPKCWQVDCSKGPDSDKEGFSALVRELSAAFKPRGFLLSSAVSPNKKVIDAGYDVPVLAEHMDWIAVMTYDYHGQWDKKTGHVAPLYHHPEDDTTFFNANYTMHYWMEKGAPASKLVMGMPMYGQSFTLGTQWDTPPELLAKKNETGLNVPARSGGEAGEFTRAKGFLAYYEICERLKNRAWTVVSDPQGRMGPYAYRGDQWVSFDDVHIIKKKVKFIRSLNLAGGMVWALDLDDFRNRCGEGKHPILTAIRNGLLEATTKEELIASAALQEPPNNIVNEDESQSIETKPDTLPPAFVASTTVVETGVSSGTSSALEPPSNSIETSADSEEYKVVCYFTNWAWYRPGPGKYTPADIDPSLCTHIVYAFAVLDKDRLIIKPHDSWADIDNKFYEKVVALKARGVKVLLGLGGWNDSAGDKYSRLVNSAAARRTFLVHALDFIEQYGFHGLDLDWEYPKCWQVDCNKGPASDKAGFSDLVKELRAAFTPKGLLLSAAVSPSKRVIDNGYDVPVLSENLDWIAVMAYDYHGQWDKKTGHVAPMYVRDDDADKTFNANFTINYWISEGASRRKLVMGLPMYGQSFSLADYGSNGLDAATYGGGEAGDETRARGFLSFYEICERIRVRNWRVIRDPSGRIGPYATKGDQWVSFDDDYMIHHKAEYIRAMGLGGGMIWALDLDDFKGKYCGCGKSPLLSTINSVLRGQQAPPPCPLDDPAVAAPTTDAPAQPPAALPAPAPAEPAPPSPDSGAEEQNEVSPLDGEPCSGNSFKPDPLDCGKYYLCNNGRYTQLPCPPPLHWNQDRCDWPSKANCAADKSKLRISTTSDKSTEPKIVCYFTNWAVYREGNGSYSPQDVDTALCTHVVYAWARLNPDTLTISPLDPSVDIDKDFYGQISELRLKGVKVVMGVGGWEDSTGDKWSQLVRSPERRAEFVRRALRFLLRWQFDGLEVSWRYPVCWQSSCEEAELHSGDRDGFSALMLELAAALRPRRLLLTAGVAASRSVAERAYHAADLAAAADWLTLATYDFHGAWEPRTAHASPLEQQYDGDIHNIESSLSYWIEAGVPVEKLVLGVPMYGQSYTLSDADVAGLEAPVAGPGAPGPLTGVPGFLAHYEICSAVKSGEWSATHTSDGSYAVRGDQWVSYWDAADAARAVGRAAARGAGGAAAWALDLDDWRGACGCGRHPLLRALRRALLEPGAPPPLACVAR